MSITRRIRSIIHRTREATGLVFYLKPRRFPVNIEITISNQSKMSKHFFAAIPLPPTTSNQQILSEPIFKPNTPEIYTDECYGNRYAVIRGELRAGAMMSMLESFMVRIEPQRPEIVRDVTLVATKEGSPYLVPNRYVQADDKRVIRLAQEIKGKEMDTFKIMRRLNEYVIGHLKYGEPIPGLYSSDDALTRPVVDCGGFDSLLAALAIAVGIPARIVSGFWASAKTNTMHAWVEMMMPDGTWVPADPSVEQQTRTGRSRRSGKLGFIGSDRVALSYGCDIPIELGGQTLTVDILQHPYVWSPQGSDGLSANATLTIPTVWRG